MKKKLFLHQNFPLQKLIEENVSYSVYELLEYMIKSSDNNAYFVLAQYLNQTYSNGKLFFEVMDKLGMIQPDNFIEDDLTTKVYSLIFAQLYFASFFDKKEISEMVLDLLANTNFHDGIVAGVPSGIIVVHKFGERVNLENMDINRLHDCGIVYYPQNPYLLCVMTKGKDMQDVKCYISNI